MYHHTPSLPMDGNAPFCALEYAAPDRSRGYAAVFRLQAGMDDSRLRLHAAPDAAYRITRMSDGASWTMNGFLLEQTGLKVVLEGALDSEMYLYSKLEERQ